MAKKKTTAKLLIPAERIERAILLIRGQKAMLDADLAELYGVETKVLNQAVSRNLDRFPADFMFRLSREELAALRSQSVTLKTGGRGEHTKYPPRAFTEQGVAMLSAVLRSNQAVAVSIEIMRTFVRLREMIASHADLVRRLDELESRYDGQFRQVFELIRQLIAPPTPDQKIASFRVVIYCRAYRTNVVQARNQ